MKIINKTIDSLIFAEYNPRQLTEEQYQQLKDSITRFGLVDPIIVNQHQDRKNIIVGGHQRTRVAKKLGIEEVPCVFVYMGTWRPQDYMRRCNYNQKY
jgi:ParB-like chromosome segregation protein Spo0J